MKEIKARFAQGCPSWIDCSEGWFPLIRETHNAILEVDPEYEIHQIKEKFGGLRYYIYGNAKAQDIAAYAEVKSFEICEVCGEPGSTRNLNGWLRTLCNTHSPEA